jgi:hypothetical protein
MTFSNDKKVKLNFNYFRKRTPEQVFYSDTSIVRGESAIKSLDEIGPIIEHTYLVKKKIMTLYFKNFSLM